jgi:SAM-dependent methyltransferase
MVADRRHPNGHGRPNVASMGTELSVDRDHLRKVAYADSRRLRDRAALYRYRRNPQSLSRWVLSHTDWPAGARVLDVGCGPGLYLALLGEHGGLRTVGVDLSEGMCREAGAHGPTTVADVATLPFPDGAFDRALAPHMLYHCPDIPAAVAELRRVVAPGGTLLAVVNSSTYLAELRGLVRAATGAEWMRVSDRITVENGAALLSTAFDDVTLATDDDDVIVPDPAPVLAYLRSTTGWEGTADAATAATEIERRLTAIIADQGAFHDTIRAGIFLCR